MLLLFDNGGCVNSMSHSCDDGVLQRCVESEMQTIGLAAGAFPAIGTSHAIVTRLRRSWLASYDRRRALWESP